MGILGFRGLQNYCLLESCRHVQSSNDSWLGAIKMLGKLMLCQLLHFVLHKPCTYALTDLYKSWNLRLAATHHH